MNNPIPTLELSSEPGFVAGGAESMRSLNATVLEIARTAIPVLIVGESGTGKEVYARLLHRLSGCAEGPLKKVNCSLFDAVQLLRQFQADSGGISMPLSGGSLLLDGIDELDPSCQRVLLSLLSDSEAQRESAAATRLISSSSRDLENVVKAGHFRKELYFRLNGVCLRLPPLRERKEDVRALGEHFLQKHALALHKAAPALSPEVLETLAAYDWPGNIRELENLARNMVALGNVEMALQEIRVNRANPMPPASFSLKNAARAASRQRERELILEALERTKWNRKRAARELQISYKALLYKLKQIGSTGTETRK